MAMELILDHLVSNEDLFDVQEASLLAPHLHHHYINTMSSSRTAVPPAQFRISNKYSLPVRKLAVILKMVIPETSLGTVEELKSCHLSRLYIVIMLDGRKLLLSYSPSLSVHLLRHEASLLRSEALLLSFIRDHQDCLRPKDQTPHNSGHSGFLDLLPKLLKHSSDSRELAMPYNILETSKTTPFSAFSNYPTDVDRLAINTQLGRLTRELASLTSPSRAFGPTIQVLTDLQRATALQHSKNNVSKTWSAAFNALFEGVLRDGEDVSVLLPYESIRVAYLSSSWRLDAVTVPRLLIMDIGHQSNVMCKQEGDMMRLVGLRSWSQGIFGDPLLADCFDSPSESFTEGWREGGEELIEDEKNYEARMALYRCFRAVVDVVTQYYRPSGESCREMEARRRLTKALADLEKLDDAGVST